jgi:hypothetical protein
MTDQDSRPGGGFVVGAVKGLLTILTPSLASQKTFRR